MTQTAGLARLVHNTGFSLGASILSRLAHVILFILISRRAGPGEAGILTIGLTYLAITGRLSIWGLDQILVRDVARDLSQSGKYLINFILIRIGLAVAVALLLAAIFYFFQPYRPAVTWLIYLIVLNMLPEGIISLGQAVFMAHERMEFMTLSGLLVGTLKLVCGGAALAWGWGILGVVAGLLVANTVAMLGTLAVVFWLFTTWRWEFDLAFCRRQLKIAAPFVIIAAAYMIDNQLDVLLLSWQVSEAQVGLYGAAVAIIVGISFLPQAYRDAVFPRLASAFFTSQPQLQQLYRQSYKYLVLMSIPITFGLMMVAKPALIWIYGPEFEAAGRALQLLAVSVGLLFLAILHNRLLIVDNQQGRIASYLAVGLVLNFGLNVGLVPLIGLTGAAVARLVSNLLVFGLTYYTTFKRVYAFDARYLWLRPVAAGLLMVAVLWVGGSWPVWLQILAGALTYGIALLLLGTFSRREVVTWLQILKLGRLASRLSV